MKPPSPIRENLPEELSDARIIGGDQHSPTEDALLYGPPGTGKTTQLCFRLAYLISVEDIAPSDITVVTYRRALAGDIRQKLVEWGVLEEDEADDLEYWGTMHAVANRVTGLLRDARERLPEDEHLGPAVEFPEKCVFASNVLDQPYTAENPRQRGIGELWFETMAWYRQNLIDPTSDATTDADLRQAPMYEDLVERWPGVDLQETARSYESWKSQRGFHDFWELLEAARGESLPAQRVVVIDEYHDAYPLMAALAEEWLHQADIRLVAADPDQVMNQFRGASPEFYERLLPEGDAEIDLPEVLLDETHRVFEEAWQAGTRVLAQERDPPPVHRTSRGELIAYQAPEIAHGDDGWRLPAPDTPGSPPWLWMRYGPDIEYLARTRSQVAGICAALDEAGILYHTQEQIRGGWASNPERRHLYNALRLLEGVDVSDVRDRRSYGLSQYGVTESKTGAGDTGQALHPPEAASLLEHTPSELLSISTAERDDLARQFRVDEKSLEIQDLDEYVTRAFWERLTAGAGSVSRLNKGSLAKRDLRAIRAALHRYNDRAPADAQMYATEVLTFHASKGSEATDIVVYAGITDRIRRAIEQSNAAAENEARTWYVALTRASRRLHIMRGGFEWIDDQGKGQYLPGDLCPVAAAAAERAVTTSETSHSTDIGGDHA